VRGLFAAISLAALVIVSGSSARALVGPSVLVSRLPASRTSPGRFIGLFRVTPQGKVQKLLAGDVAPVSLAATGAAVGYPADPHQNRLLLAVGGNRAVLPHSESGGWCAAMSPDGSLVAWVNGMSTYVRPNRHLLYTRVEGTLWVAETAHLDRAQAVEDGAFTLSECPLWSPNGNKLAYFVQQAVPAWALSIYDHGAVHLIATVQTPVPSAHDRSFAWSRDGRLAYMRRRDIFVGTRRVGWQILNRLSPRATSEYNRAIAVSPNGRLIAASFGFRTGIFRLNGGVARVTFGHLRDWSGNAGVLTNGLSGLTPTLFRVPVRGRVVPLATHFKTPVVADPGGAWFAYEPAAKKELVFRRSDGTLLRTVRLGFIPSVIAAAGKGGRVNYPHGSY
jgi:hypothetical protein